jgi:hypothetical protein
MMILGNLRFDFHTVEHDTYFQCNLQCPDLLTAFEKNMSSNGQFNRPIPSIDTPIDFVLTLASSPEEMEYEVHRPSFLTN